MFYLNGGLVRWKSSKQKIDSTIEVENIVASNAPNEDVCIKKFITELDIVPTIANPNDIHCDNKYAVAQDKKFKSH